MKLMMKTSNLVILSVMTEFMVLVTNGLQIGEYWLSINHTINVLCIYLSFGGFNDNIYDKLCCCVDKYCHKCCYILNMKLTISTIKKSVKQDEYVAMHDIDNK